MMDWISAVPTVGFPIVACAYLAFRFERTLEKNTAIISDLRDAFLTARIVRMK